MAGCGCQHRCQVAVLGASGLSVVTAGWQRSLLHSPARAHPPLPSPSHRLHAPACIHPPTPASRQCLNSHTAYTCPPTTCTHLYSLPAPAHAAFTPASKPCSLPEVLRATRAGGRQGSAISKVCSLSCRCCGGWRWWDREAVGAGAWCQLPDSSFITAAGPDHRGNAGLDSKLENKPRIL